MALIPEIFTVSDVLAIIGLLGIGFGVAKYYFNLTQDNRIERKFIYSIATNHLPHIYTALRLIAKKLDIDVDEHPNIDFIDLNQK